MATIGEGVATVAAAVGGVGEGGGAGIDVVLFGGVVDGVGPGPGGEGVEAAGEAFVEAEVQAVVVRLADGFGGENVVEAGVDAAGAEDGAAVGERVGPGD